MKKFSIILCLMSLSTVVYPMHIKGKKAKTRSPIHKKHNPQADQVKKRLPITRLLLQELIRAEEREMACEHEVISLNEALVKKQKQLFEERQKSLEKKRALLDELCSANKQECSICFENMCGQKRKQLPCGHRFHKACINTWLARDAACPICKKAVDR